MGIDFSKPNGTRDPLELLAETEGFLIAEANAISFVLGENPVADRMRGRASYIRNIRLAISESQTNPILPHEQQMVDGEWNR
jgi:hypothetical protein